MEKIQTIRELCRELDRIEGELEALILSPASPVKSGKIHKDGTLNKHGSASGIKYPRGKKECCGSLGARHKKGCEGAPVGSKDTKSKRYKCMDETCAEVFTDDREYLDITCAKCEKTHVIQLP